MKTKLYQASIALTLIALFSLGCKKKNPAEPEVSSTCEIIYDIRYGQSPTVNGTVTANYENGRMKSLSSTELNLAYEYTADRITVSAAGTPYYRVDLSGQLATRITELNSSWEYRISYDSNRNLAAIETYSDGTLQDTKTFTHSNGNLTSQTQTYPDDPTVKKVTTYRYAAENAGTTDKETRNLFFSAFDLPVPLYLTGTSSANVLTGSTYTYTSGNFRSDITKTYTYTRDAKGVLNKIVEDSHTITVSNGVQTQDERGQQTIMIRSTCN